MRESLLVFSACFRANRGERGADARGRLAPRPVLARVAVCCALLVGSTQIVGCSAMPSLAGDPAQITSRIEQRIDDLDARYAHTEQSILARIDQMNTANVAATDPSRMTIDGMLVEVRAARAVLDSARTHLSQVAAEAEAITTGTGVVSDTFNRLSVLIPEPFRSPAVLGVGLLAALWRARSLRKGLASVAKGIDKVMDKDPEFATRFVKHADTLRTIQTDTAKKVIDQTLSRSFRLHLPF